MDYWVEKAEQNLALARQDAALRAAREAAEAVELAKKEAKEAAANAELVRSKFPPMPANFFQL